MKLSIISKDKTAPHVQAILQAAQKLQVKAEVFSLVNLEELKKIHSKLGDVVYWRAAGLDIRSERASASSYLSSLKVINQSLFSRPYVTHKFYQQAVVQAAGIAGIETYKFRRHSQIKQALKDGILTLPFIAKPDLGARGRGVTLISTDSNIDGLTGLKDLVLQTYIKNQGDWRVIMLGGRSLGVMKRTAIKGSLLNNIAQGGHPSVETDPLILRAVIDIASKASATLDLAFCGVDIIRDDTTSEYKFLEVNTAPEWLGGFQLVTKVDVAEELVKYAVEINKRQYEPIPGLIKDYYQASMNLAGTEPDDIFHFASRLYLWSGSDEAKQLIGKVKGAYLGGNKLSIKQKLGGYLTQVIPPSLIPDRQNYFEKYPKLRSYNRMLFKVYFAQTVYHQDLSGVIREFGIDDELRELYNRILADKKAIQILSTHAVNFLFLANSYFGSEPAATRRLENSLLKEAQQLITQRANSRITATSLKLDIYMISHIIIARSKFYQEPVSEPAYKKLVEYLEKNIAENYMGVSLDLKLEYLICAQLCGYPTWLEPIIYSEAEASLSEIGNFLVDTHNKSAKRRVMKDRLWQSEHRSVLYIMSKLPYQHGKLEMKRGSI